MVSKYSVLVYLVIFSVTGCVFLSQELMTLKSVGDSQVQIDRYLERQDKLFGKLLEDIEAKELEPGILKSDIMNVYGEPILTKQIVKGLPAEEFLYRHPLEYFNSEKVYLYFDEDDRLLNWRYEPKR